MSSIPETIRHLSALATRYGARPNILATDRLLDMSTFGSNPGALRARFFVPHDLAPRAALVVVLHGCTQTAAAYDHGSGWSRVAEEHGFALLFPEQQRCNNPHLCFNWFAREDARRDQGEAMSIRQMIAGMIAEHALDPARVFVTGLSAGGAMSAAMLASYPDVFAGGAVIAGLPYGTAWSVPEALTRMRGQGLPSDSDLAALAKAAAGHEGPWPTLSIWHGDADATVSLANTEALLRQWQGLHGIGPVPSEVEKATGHRRRAWRDASGREIIEDYLVFGMGHGTPLKTIGGDGCGASGPHMLDVGLSSTRLIAAHWGLNDATRPTRSNGRPEASRIEKCGADGPPPFNMPVQASSGIERTITDAFRAAGLLR